MNPIEAGARAYEQVPSPCERHEKVQVSTCGSYAVTVLSCPDCNKNRIRAAAIAMVGALTALQLEEINTFCYLHRGEIDFPQLLRAELMKQLTED